MSEKKNFEYYLHNFLLGISYTQNIDYGERKDVRRNNRGVNMYRKAAEAIGNYYPEKIGEFSKLLFDSSPEVRIACAISVLTLMEAEPKYKEVALKIIRDLASEGDPLEKTAWTMWLEERGYGASKSPQTHEESGYA